MIQAVILLACWMQTAKSAEGKQVEFPRCETIVGTTPDALSARYPQDDIYELTIGDKPSVRLLKRGKQ
jgi:hypothetical protein